MAGTTIDSAGEPAGPRAPEHVAPPERLRAAGRVSGGRLAPSTPLCTRDEVEPVDALSELEALAEGRVTRLSDNGLADRLLAWVAPRPRHPDTLEPARIVPLLGMAAELLSSAAGEGDLASLGAAALAQELRQHRDLAERRATLIEG